LNVSPRSRNSPCGLEEQTVCCKNNPLGNIIIVLVLPLSIGKIETGIGNLCLLSETMFLPLSFMTRWTVPFFSFFFYPPEFYKILLIPIRLYAMNYSLTSILFGDKISEIISLNCKAYSCCNRFPCVFLNQLSSQLFSKFHNHLANKKKKITYIASLSFQCNYEALF
jgi:hypothetical protein